MELGGENCNLRLAVRATPKTTMLCARHLPTAMFLLLLPTFLLMTNRYFVTTSLKKQYAHFQILITRIKNSSRINILVLIKSL